MVSLRDIGSLRGFFSNLHTVFAPYKRSPEFARGLGLLVLTIFASLAVVFLTKCSNSANGAMFSALERKDLLGFKRQIFVLVYLLVALVPLVAIFELLMGLLSLSLRQWLTTCLWCSWTKGGAFYRWHMKEERPDNPDQRISNDADYVSASLVSLIVQVTNSACSFVTFSIVLIQIWGAKSIVVLGISVPVAYAMLALSFCYAFAGTMIARLFSKPLTSLSALGERLEANFHYQVIRTRDRAEEIALMRGEAREEMSANSAFAKIKDNLLKKFRLRFGLNVYRSIYSNADQLLPFVIGIAFYTKGEIALGVLMQSSGAFAQVNSALSMFVREVTGIASVSASLRRIAEFLRFNEEDQPSRTIASYGATLDASDLQIATPDGRELFAAITLHVEPGERVMITGNSGIGKTTLIRTLAGLWPHSSGSLSVPREALYSPQKPYFPIDTLIDAICYPLGQTIGNKARVAELLSRFKMPQLVARLDEQADWGALLSLGEQQRLSFIRVILSEASWIFLDEPTSALNREFARACFETMISELPHSTIVTVTHSSFLKQFHQREVRASAWRLRGAGNLRKRVEET